VREAMQPWLPILIAAAAVHLSLATMLVRNRYGPGARTIGLALLAVALWISASIGEARAASPDTFLLAAKLKYTAIALVAPLCFLFFLQYAERAVLRPWLAAAVFAVPLATIALIWTNEWHQWMWRHPPFGPGEEPLVRMPWGPWYWCVHVPYSYGLLAVGLALMAAELRSESRLYRSQVALILAGVVLPLAINMLFLANWFSPRFSPTPVAFAVSGVLFAWGYVRLQLFRLSPVAYRAVFEHLADGVIVADRFDRVVDVNAVALGMLDRPSAELIGYRVEQALPVRDAGAQPGEARGAIECEAADGRLLEVSTSPIHNASGALHGRVVVLRDVTARRRAEAALRESEALVRSIVEHSPSGILRLRPVRGEDGDVRDFVCVFANAAAAASIGRPREELVGRPFKGAVHPHTAALFQAFREVVRTGTTCDLERAIGRGGVETWLRFVAVKVGDDLSVTFFDVTERRQREREMEAAACQDPLTGLLNRRGFEADAPALLLSPEGTPRSCALLYVDLDRFKEVNDSFGHDVGDALLREFAERLARCTRGPDLLARIGGDEFVLLLLDAGVDGAFWVAERILAAAREPVRIGARTLACYVSVGVALCPEHGYELKTLLHAADRAMYAAKSRGSGVAAAG